MSAVDEWDQLRGSREQRAEALTRIKQTHDDNTSPANIMALGVAYMFLEHYELAHQHFLASVSAHNSASFFGMAGASQWCLGKPSKAVLDWRSGLSAKYATSPLKTPLLLLWAGNVYPGTVEQREAFALTKSKLSQTAISHWLNPLVAWVLDQSNSAALGSWIGGAGEAESSNRKWLARFYEVSMQLGRGEIGRSRFRHVMASLADTSQRDWKQRDCFLSRIWSEEFYLARYSARKRANL